MYNDKDTTNQEKERVELHFLPSHFSFQSVYIELRKSPNSISQGFLAFFVTFLLPYLNGYGVFISTLMGVLIGGGVFYIFRKRSHESDIELKKKTIPLYIHGIWWLFLVSFLFYVIFNT